MEKSRSHSPIDPWILLAAQGLGSGRLPGGPGTWGSGVGLFFFLALVGTGSVAGFAIGCLLGIASSVWLCGRAEVILGKSDPGSVVADEICAVPLCFISWLAMTPAWPGPSDLLRGHSLLILGLGFGLFRLFDIWKPWPIRQSQCIHGGWGVTVDDLLASVYVNIAMIPFCIWLPAEP